MSVWDVPGTRYLVYFLKFDRFIYAIILYHLLRRSCFFNSNLDVNTSRNNAQTGPTFVMLNRVLPGFCSTRTAEAVTKP